MPDASDLICIQHYPFVWFKRQWDFQAYLFLNYSPFLSLRVYLFPETKNSQELCKLEATNWIKHITMTGYLVRGNGISRLIFSLLVYSFFLSMDVHVILLSTTSLELFKLEASNLEQHITN